MTGVGDNVSPALKKAHVGIAVESAIDAALLQLFSPAQGFQSSWKPLICRGRSSDR